MAEAITALVLSLVGLGLVALHLLRRIDAVQDSANGASRLARKAHHGVTEIDARLEALSERLGADN